MVSAASAPRRATRPREEHQLFVPPPSREDGAPRPRPFCELERPGLGRSASALGGTAELILGGLSVIFTGISAPNMDAEM